MPGHNDKLSDNGGKAPSNETGKMPTVKDIRQENEDLPTRAQALVVRWPCAPEDIEASKSSGLICAAIVARAMWSRLEPMCWPEPSSSDLVTAYIFVDFRQDKPGFMEALREIWPKVRESAVRQQDGKIDESFAGIVRGPAFVRAFWMNPRFQLTTPHRKASWSYDEPQVVLAGEGLARPAVVAWDGLEPANVKEAVDNLTRKEYDDQGNMTFMFFRSPLLIQVDFTPAEGSKASLADMQQFSADSWAFVPDPYGMRIGQWTVTGQQLYTIMAVVLHRETMDGVDSVRLFRGNGKEELPAAHRGRFKWPFELDEAIPVGRRVTVFYNSVPADNEVHDRLRWSERFPKMPVDLETKIRTLVTPVPMDQVDNQHGQGLAAGSEQQQVESWVSEITTDRDNSWHRSLPWPENADPEDHETSFTPARRPLPRRAKVMRRKNLFLISESNLQPAGQGADTTPVVQPPTGPRTDKSALPLPLKEPLAYRLKKRQIDGEEAERDGHKRLKLQGQILPPRGGTATVIPDGANAQPVSRNSRLSAESNRSGQVDPGSHAYGQPQNSHAEYGAGRSSQG